MNQYWLLLGILLQCPVANSVERATWICVSISRIQVFSKWAILCCSNNFSLICSNIFSPSTFLFSSYGLVWVWCPANPCELPHLSLPVPSTAIVLSQVFLNACCLPSYTSWCNCLQKWLLKHISPLLFRTSEGHLVKSMTRTSYFWVPHSISKRWL